MQLRITKNKTKQMLEKQRHATRLTVYSKNEILNNCNKNLKIHKRIVFCTSKPACCECKDDDDCIKTKSAKMNKISHTKKHWMIPNKIYDT